MQLIATTSNDSKKARVFGYLYVAVFSNGTVKAGMAKSDAQSRITTHAHAGRAFCIELSDSFVASIYTDDVKQRETQMHKELSKVARLTAGREWFKFDKLDSAVNFSSSYLHGVERMSFVERPSEHEVTLSRKKKASAIDELQRRFDATRAKQIAQNDSATNEEIDEIVGFLNSKSDALVCAMARNVAHYEDYLWLNEHPMHAQIPLVAKAVDEFYENPDFDAASDGPMTRKNAMDIILAAVNYRQFFVQAMSFKDQEVPA